MSDDIDLGIRDLRPLPGIAAEPARWEELRQRLQRKAFLRSEGLIVKLAAPQIVEGALLERSREVADRLNRFFADVATTYYQRQDLRDEYLVNPLLAPLIDLDASSPSTTPLSRLDLVLEADGSLRVIEINPIGVTLAHLRGLLYLIRGLAANGFEPDARRLDTLTELSVDAFRRYYEAHQPSPRARPVLGAVTPSGWFPAGHLLFRAAFQRMGWDYVFGGPEHLDVAADGIRVRGQPIDVLWADFLFYFGYQETRYSQTRFPSKLADYGSAPAQVEAILSSPHFLDHLRSRRVVNVSPGRAYLPLPKSLLSWVHRTDRPVREEDRAWLDRHIARTYSARDRSDGIVTREDTIARRGDLLLKPCLYGGSHGVMIGRVTSAEEWAQKVAAIWDDPTWVVQEFHTPVKTASGKWVSYGMAGFDGHLGGVYLRTGDSLVLSARDAGFVPVVLGRELSVLDRGS